MTRQTMSSQKVAKRITRLKVHKKSGIADCLLRQGRTGVGGPIGKNNGKKKSENETKKGGSPSGAKSVCIDYLDTVACGHWSRDGHRNTHRRQRRTYVARGRVTLCKRAKITKTKGVVREFC